MTGRGRFGSLGLDFRAVIADSGAIGGSRSEEFHVLADSGEDAIAYCEADGFAANIETVALEPPAAERAAPGAESELIHTPDVRSIENLGAFLKVDPEQCLKTLLVAGSDAPAKPADAMASMIGQAPAMQEVFRSIGRLAGSSMTVLITGESGTGKELVARAIYQHSGRVEAPFLAINCAAIPDNMLEAVLFGYEKGAFTGATGRKTGRFEIADQGTLFMDEVGEIPPSMQVKLLRVLQEGEITPLGEVKPVKVDVRVIVATNRDPFAALRHYKKRWQIECLFGDTKTRGLNMEDTRLTQPEKLGLLTAIVALPVVGLVWWMIHRIRSKLD